MGKAAGFLIASLAAGAVAAHEPVVVLPGDGRHVPVPFHETTLLLGDRTVEAGPGTFAALNRGTVHAFWNATDRPVRTLFLVSRGGFEQFFDAVAVALRDQPPTDPTDANARVADIAAGYGIQLRPELIPAEVRPLYAPE